MEVIYSDSNKIYDPMDKRAMGERWDGGAARERGISSEWPQNVSLCELRIYFDLCEKSVLYDEITQLSSS